MSSFADVSITGNFDVGYQAVNVKGDGVTGINGNGSSTSAIFFTGKEDLGGGLGTEWLFETDISTAFNRGNTGAASVYSATAANNNASAAGSFGNGEIRAGLTGGFGRVDAGVVNFNTLGTFGTGQPFATAIGSGYGSYTRVNAAGSAVRADNSIRYTSPNISGFTFTLYESAKQSTGANASNNFSTSLGVTALNGSQEFGVNYAGGPLAASYSSLKQDSVGVIATTGGAAGTTISTVNTFGANYTFGAFKAMVLNQTNSTQTASVDTTYTSLSGVYTVGPVAYMITAGTAKDRVAGLTSTLTGLGVDYNLSKTTVAYARYENDKDTAGLITTTGYNTVTGNNTRTRTAVGVRVGF